MGLQAWKQRDQKGGVCSSLRERAVAGLGFGQGGWGARGNRRQSWVGLLPILNTNYNLNLPFISLSLVKFIDEEQPIQFNLIQTILLSSLKCKIKN